MELGAERMGDRVRFLQLPHDELPEAYRAADIFALGSLFETFGIVYLEAMAMRVPVIATNHANQRQILGDAVFVDMKQPGALREAIVGLVPSERARLGAAGRRRVEECYDLSQLRHKYVDMYQQVARTTIEPGGYSVRQRLKNNLRNLLG